jgi:hypothetical protein
VVDNTKGMSVADYKNMIPQYRGGNKILVHNLGIEADPLDW